MRRKDNKIKKRFEQIVILIICMLIMVTAAAQRDGKVWGHSLSADDTTAMTGKTATADTIRTLDDGTVVVNTTALAKDISGFGGPVPLEIYIKDGKIEKVEALKNSETPDFFDKAKALLTRWNGKTIEEAQAMSVDGVSGATFSSRGIIGNMQRGLQYAAKNAKKPSLLDKMDHSPKTIAGLIVVLLGAIIPLFYRNRRWRTIQLALNVIVLGLWCGTFLSWSLFISYASNGINVLVSLIPIIMLITAFIYPLFGKKQYYCTHICPFGSLQELAGRPVRKKLHMSPKTVRRLDMFRKILFGVLMLLTLTGIFSAWTDYELFTAFIWQSASVVVIIIAILFVVLSVFVPRPYCRFVCPTGTVFKAL